MKIFATLLLTFFTLQSFATTTLTLKSPLSTMSHATIGVIGGGDMDYDPSIKTIVNQVVLGENERGSCYIQLLNPVYPLDYEEIPSGTTFQIRDAGESKCSTFDECRRSIKIYNNELNFSGHVLCKVPSIFKRNITIKKINSIAKDVFSIQ